MALWVQVVPRGARRAVLFVCAICGLHPPANLAASETQPAAVILQGLNGEQCAPGDRADRGTAGVVTMLRCDGIEAGKLVRFALPLPAAGMRASSDRLASTLAAYRPRIAQLATMSCRPAMALSLADWSDPTILVQACRSIADGWPRLVVASIKAGELRIAIGVATAAPALLAMASNQQPPDGLVSQFAQWWPDQPVIGTIADQEQVRQLWSRARIDMARSAPQPAEAALRQALAIRQRVLPNDTSGNAGLIMDLALAVALGGRAEEAEALIRKAETSTAALADAAQRPRLAAYRSQLATLRGDADRAAQEAAAAVVQWRQLAEGDGAAASSPERAVAGAELAMALNLEAMALLRTGDVTSASVRASEALVAIDAASVAPAWWRGEILATLGEATAGLGRISAAEKYFQAALRVRSGLFGDSAATMRLWVSLARSYEAAQLPANAIAAYRRAIALASGLPRGRNALSDADLIPFAQAVDAMLPTLPDPRDRQGLLAELFAAFQMSRSPDLEHSNNQVASRLAEQTPELGVLLRRQAETAQQVAETRVALAGEQAKSDDADDRLPPSALAALASGFANSQQLQASLDAQIANQFPQFVALTRPRQQLLDDVRAALEVDELLVQFLIGRDRTYVLLARRTGLQLISVSLGDAALADMVRRLRRGLEIEGGMVGEFDLATAHDLYRKLLGPANFDGVNRMTVIPAGNLSGLPFGMLVTAPAQPGRYAEADWLVRRMAISHAPSLTSFMALRSTQVVRHAPKMMLAVANPSLTGQQSAGFVMARAFAGCRGPGPVDAQMLRSLVALPETGNEVRDVAAAIGAGDATILTGDAASEPGLRNAVPGDYRILYFATHGLIPGELQCQNEPGLVLTPPTVAAETQASDGLLAASEIVGLDLRADLVVLSACNTATPGAARTGSGALAGLAEAFFRAGARSVLASHWQVPSAATGELMRGLFGSMGAVRTRPVDEALREAQLASLRQPPTAHPFFWAAFVVIGDGKTAPLADGGQP